MDEPSEFETALRPMFALPGKVALVTGGAAGMGKAAGLILASAGAQVILVDEHESVADLNQLPHNVRSIVLDITDEAAISQAVARIVADYGGIDILVNGAVLNHNKPLLEISGEEWDHVQAVNLKSAFLVTKAVIPAMRPRGGGRIINITTMGSLHPVLHGNAAYSSSRAGLNQLARNIALDFAADNITSNTVAPGAIVTEAIKTGFRPTGPGSDRARHLSGHGKPEDIGGLVLLLAGPSGRFINGQTIVADGGFLIS